MKTPKIWINKNLIAYSLLPLSLLYLIGFYLRRLFIKPYKSSIPVICVGNAVSGGAGKTPVALEIGKILNKAKITFAYLNKGYKGNFDGVLKVEKYHSSILVGDEAILLNQVSDVFIAQNRVDGLKLINSLNKYKVVVVDDGFQNPTFFKNKSILVLDGKYGVGNGFTLPAGPCREFLSMAIKRTDGVVIIGQNISLNFKTTKPIFKSSVKILNGKDFKGKKVIAFSGIANPDKFFHSLKNSGAKIIEKIDFSDHHFFTLLELKFLFDKAKELDCELVTTEKDWVRLPKEYQDKIKYLKILVLFIQERSFKDFILDL